MQGGGNLRSMPHINGNESSTGYYIRSDARSTNAGDAWVSGVHSWGHVGYNIGTPGLNSCLYKQ